jgi:intein/homing endonuclease
MVKKITFPKYSEELAEFLGILFGDGYLNKYARNKYLIEIAGHSEKDLEYHYFIRKYCEKFFNISPKLIIRKDQNTLYSRIISKNMFLFLRSAGMPKGKKTRLSIPSWIKKNSLYLNAFIRGVYDTDGSIILRKRKQNSISLKMKSKTLVNEIKEALEQQGYFVAYNVEKRSDPRGFNSTTYCIRINRKVMIKRFMEEIGSSNPYKLKKWWDGNAGI